MASIRHQPNDVGNAAAAGRRGKCICDFFHKQGVPRPISFIVSFFFSSRRRHTRYIGDWSSDVCSSDLVGQKLGAGTQPLASDEDVHTLIDRMLHDEVGDVASKLHTGRSRNDQVATATRLWCMDACTKLDTGARSLQQVMVDHAASLEDVLMPAYTHLQRAQPVSAAHWMLSHFWPLERDRARIAAASRAAAVLPLGAGAIAGCAFPISRVLLQGSLGFTTLSQNSIDAVGDRDFVAELLFAVAMIATHIARLADRKSV